MRIIRAFGFASVTLLLGLNSSVLLASQSLDAVESAIVDWSETHAENAVSLLEELVVINSGTQNLPGVKKVGMVLREELDELGFRTRWVDMPAEMQRAGHLFGKLEGDRGKKFLLIGHLDTVFEADSDFQEFERDGATAIGPGVEDMKSGYCSSFNSISTKDFLTENSQPTKSDLNLDNLCESIYVFSGSSNELLVSRSGLMKKEVLTLDDKSKDVFRVRMNFYLDRQYLLTRSDCV